MLEDVGVVRVREFETGNRVRGYPYQFFEITSEARVLFDQNGLFPEEAWKRQYATVEKTNRIEDTESMPDQTTTPYGLKIIRSTLRRHRLASVSPRKQTRTGLTRPITK